MAADALARPRILAGSRERTRGTFVEHGAAMNVFHRLSFALVASAGGLAVPACQHARAAEAPKMIGPSVQIEVEDRAPGGGHAHSARFDVSLSNGFADIDASDGDAHYAISANVVSSSEPKVGLKVKRTERSPSADIAISAAIPQQPGARIVVARIDRADGHVTTILAQAR